MLYLLALGFVGVAVVWQPVSAETRYECTKEQAATDGYFECLPGCDDNHYGNGYKYCLNYFPDGGNCYMKPYTREQIMTCNGQVGPNDPPMWLVLIGGSNQYIMLKEMLDDLLNLPPDAGYNPTAYWNAHPYELTGEELYSEIAIMDFVWDAQHNILRRTAWWWDADCYYCLPSETEQVFLDVPAVSKGSFRVSYANIHFADEFPDRFNKIVRQGSNWVNANPTIHIYMEWSGMWGDGDIPSSVHEANLQFLKSRQASEGLNIASFVFTDSAPSCTSGVSDNIARVYQAFNAVPTSFPKRFFSKQEMQRSHYYATGTCLLNGGHAMAPLNIVFWRRWINTICNPSTPDTTYRPSIPECADLGDWTNTNMRCFNTGDGHWMNNIMSVCKMSFLPMNNDPPCQVRVAHREALQHEQKRRICKLQQVANTSAASEGAEGGLAQARRIQKIATRQNMRSLFTRRVSLEG